MKILIVTQYWYPENGVPQRRWQWLSRLLVAEGHEVTVIAPPPNYNEMLERSAVLSMNRQLVGETELGPSGESIIRSGFLPARKTLTSKIAAQATGAAGQLRQILKLASTRPRDFDLVIGTVPALPTAYVTRLTALVMKTPYIIDLRDAWPDLLQNSDRWNQAMGSASLRARIAALGPLQVMKRVTAWSINRSLRSANGIMVTTRGMKEVILSDSTKNKTADKVSVVRNVFSEDNIFRESNHPVRPDNSLHVLYAGTAGRAQNLSNALRAARIASEKGVDVRMRIVGAGDSRNWLEKVAGKERVAVSFEEAKPAADLTECYDWADTALVHLTDWEPLERTIPSKTYELMAMGVHITGVVKGEAAALIEDLGAGDIVPPESPEQLATLWCELAADRSRLLVSNEGAKWVRLQREEVVPEQFLSLVETVGGDV